MHWTDEWSIENVEQNYKVLGCIDPEDVVQLIADAKELRAIKQKEVNLKLLNQGITPANPMFERLGGKL